MSNHCLAGRLGIITGAASGIGHATAQLAASCGADVLAVDLDRVKLHATLAEGSEGNITPVVCDVSDEARIEETLAPALASSSCAPSFLVNCAGTEGPMALLRDISVADFDRVMAVNVRSTFMMLKLVLPAMTNAGAGSIVNIASIASLGGAGWMSSYAASKHAVLGLTRAVVAEVAEYGVRVNAVCPGPIDTTMQARAERLAPDPSEFRARQEAAIPQRRYGKPEEVASLVLFLVGDGSSYINGAAITLDGGMTAVL
jgi:NAD(P)-dependent dehydrogenase (short-subunit alcohol dehydrogenase family)